MKALLYYGLFSIEKIKIFAIFCISFFCFSHHAYSGMTSLELTKESVSGVSGNSISFQGVASNSISYKAKVICFNQEFNYKEGSIIVLKTESHVGAGTNFPYDDCLDMRKALLSGEEKVLLSWDQEKFDAFISANLDFQRIDDK